MVVWRRWIFPVLMLVVCGAIAAALVKLAFFPDETATAVQPGGAVAAPTVPVERGNITDDLEITGTVARDAPVVVRGAVDGVITDVKVAAGQSVAAGQPLVTVKQTDPVKNIDIVAPEAGELAEFTLVKGQPISIGAEAATLTPARYHVVGTVDPLLLYRLVNAPTEAQVTIQGGPAPFTCTGMKVTVGEDATTSVECAIPGDQQVFAGLQATLAVTVGSVADALVVPTTAVAGGAGSGTVWVDADGEASEREVQLGITDGTLVEVTGGLEEGDTIRQFAPGQNAGDEPVCYDDGIGGEYCEDPGMNW
jgi:macrolide-specific efflux system membrane fusion protein